MTSNSIKSNSIKSSEVMEGYYSKLLSEMAKQMRTDNGGSIVNIITNYPWSLNAKNVGNSNRIPTVYVKEYRQKLSTFVTSVQYAFTGATTALKKGPLTDVNSTADTNNKFNAIIAKSNGHLSPYYNMYSLDDTNCLNYVFPYFSVPQIGLKNRYAENAQSGGGKLANVISDYIGPRGALAGFAEDANEIIGFVDLLSGNNHIGDEGIYVEKPKYFQYSEEASSITVEFTLYNTIPSTDNSPWKKNYNFIKNFILKNLPYKISFFSYKTPALYEVNIPGIKYLPISFISNMNVTNIGTSRMLNYSGSQQVLVPEAWNITITFQSLLNDSANIFTAALTKGPVIRT